MNPATAAALPGLRGNELWQDEGMVNSIWNGILNSTYGAMTLAGNTYIIAPELWKGNFKADLAVMFVNVNGTFNKPSLCFEGKGGSNSETLMNAVDQIKSWTTSAKIGGGGSIWGLAAKADTYVIVALDRARDDNWYGVVFPTVANGAPTYDRLNYPAYNITNAGDLARLGFMLAYIALNPNPRIPMQR